jgi:glycosyltransferase involved in cell wall biosynthesis
MRVGYLSAMNYHSWGAFSGIVHAMHRELSERPGIELLDLGAARPQGGLPARIATRLGLLRHRYDMRRASERERFRAHLHAQLQRTKPDVLFAPVAAAGIALIETDLPMVYCSDATFRLLESTYHLRAAPEIAEFRERSERAAIRRANRLLYPSKWAAESAIQDYGASRDRVDLAPFGANLLEMPSTEGLFDRSPSRKDLRLLFVGREYDRKGGPIALETIASLHARGCRARLSLVGCVPPQPAEGVEALGFFDKDDPQQAARLADLFRSSHILVFPTRADCSPVSLCEASAYGLPVVSTNVGGIPEILDDDPSLLLPLEARGEAFATAILELIENPERYRALAKSRRRRFEEDLNWQTWAERAERSLGRALEG